MSAENIVRLTVLFVAAALGIYLIWQCRRRRLNVWKRWTLKVGVPERHGLP